MSVSGKTPAFACVRLLPVILACVGVLVAGIAEAADSEPFHVDDRQWMSLDFYRDALKHPSSNDDNQTRAPEVAQPVPAAPALPDVKEAAKDQTASAPVVAAPTRPIDLPVMPGVNKGYDVKVSSTSDDVLPNTGVVKITDDQPGFVLPATHWQSATDVAHQIKPSGDEDSENQPIDVRISYLPNKKIVPADAVGEAKTHGRPANAAQVASIVPEPVKSPAELAACAAVDLYKKRQLEAIQGDRETLKALQAAISQLGLQKQLSFIPGADSNVAGAESGVYVPNMDIPVSGKP